MFQRARRVGLTALIAAGLLATPAVASAQGGPQGGAPEGDAPGNVVAIGDSITADPTVNEWFPFWIGMETPAVEASPAGCPTSPTSYAKQVGERLGLPVDDYSCTGLSMANPKTRNVPKNVDKAIENGALNPSTQRVLITVGFNDSYTENAGTNEDKVRRFVEEGTTQINRIREAAPNARIQIVGYPTISVNGGDICPVQVIDDRILPTPPIHVSKVAEFENLAQEMDRQLAENAGVEFLNMKPSTANTGMCANDDVREYAGVVDTTGPDFHLPFHVNARGHQHIADEIVNS